MLTSEIALFFAALAGLLVASWFHGGHHVRTHEFATATPPKPVRVDTATPTRFVVTEPDTAPITGVVIPLPQISFVTASLDVIGSPEIVRENDTLSADLVHALARIAELEEALEAKTAESVENLRLRVKHYKSARRAQGRYRAVVSATFEAQRRPSCERALALVTEIGTARSPEHTKVITPQTHQRWVEQGLVAA